jgi:hypothetical protein
MMNCGEVEYNTSKTSSEAEPSPNSIETSYSPEGWDPTRVANKGIDHDRGDTTNSFGKNMATSEEVWLPPTVFAKREKLKREEGGPSKLT